MHFMNPVPVMTLVEVIRGIATSDETWQKVEDLSKKMGTPIEVNDYPGSSPIACGRCRMARKEAGRGFYTCR